MSIGTKIYSFFKGKKVGQDEFGNTYFTHKKLGNKKRWVIYKGIAEASKIPAIWHLWLHYTSDKIPDDNKVSYEWQKTHIPNLTGTDLAYLPKGHVTNNTQRQKTGSDYQAWKP